MTTINRFTAPLLAVASVASGLDNMPMEDLIDHLVDTFESNLEEGHGAQLMGAADRRLSAASAWQMTGDAGRGLAEKGGTPTKKGLGTVPSVTYSTVCTGTCWNAVKTEFAASLVVLDNATCKQAKNKEKVAKVKQGKGEAKKRKDDIEKAAGGKPGGKVDGKPAGEGGNRRLAPKKKAGKKEANCIFDLCKEEQVIEMCGNVTNATNVVAAGFELDACKKANADFMCKSICAPACDGDADMRTLLCGKAGSDSGKFDSEKGGGGLKSMFNGICTKDANGLYCYDEIKKAVAADKFAVAKEEGKFPDPCSADCSGTMATTITGLGCCFPAMMEAQRKYKVLGKAQVRIAKSTAVKCAKDTAFTACTGGALTKCKSKQFNLNVTVSCDSIATEEQETAFATSVSDQLNLTAGDVEMLTCKEKGKKCVRRLGESNERRLSTGSEVEINVAVSGEDADSQMATLTTQMDSDLADDIATTAGEMAEVEVAEAEVAANSTTSAGLLVSSALVGHVSSLASAIVIGFAWLRN